MAILPLPSDRKEWLKLRRDYIGGSEVAALFGLQQDYQTSAFALWHDKAGLVVQPDVENERTETGIEMEETIARMAGKRFGWAVSPGVYAVDDSVRVVINGVPKGMGASLDRVIQPSEEDLARGRRGPGVLQIKNVDGGIYRSKWLDGEPPESIILQIQHEMACFGASWGVVVAFVNGNRLVPWYTEQDARIIGAIRSAVIEFWESIRGNRVPDVSGSGSDTYAVNAVAPEINQELTIDLTGDNELPVLCEELNRLSRGRIDGEKREKEIKNIIRLKMKEARYARIAGGIKITQTVIKDIPGRPPKPGELVGARKGYPKITVTIPKETA